MTPETLVRLFTFALGFSGGLVFGMVLVGLLARYLLWLLERKDKPDA